MAPIVVDTALVEEAHESSELQPVETPFEFNEKECNELFALGKRNLVCGDVPTAVNQLQLVCKQLATKYGETAAECADALYQYGIALLELSRMESRVLGNALQGMTEDEDAEQEGDDGFAVPTTITEEEKERISEEVLEAMLEPDSSIESKGPEVSEKMETTATEAEAKEATPDSAAVETSSVAEPTVAEPATVEAEAAPSKSEDKPEKASEEEKGDKDDDKENENEESESGDDDPAGSMEDDTTQDESQNEEEEVSNLQLAWETLELAKTIYQKQSTKEAKLKSADCLKKLAEVGLESENYSQSIDDFKTSLEILKECVDDVSADRRIAETHYHIGVACVNAQRYDEAVGSFKNSVAVLEAKIVKLNEVVAVGAGDQAGGEVDVARNELKEIGDLIPEIKVKIEDAEEEKNSVHLKDVIKEQEATSSGFSEMTSSSTEQNSAEAKPVNDVTHLVRKKRKAEDDNVLVDDVKKSKTCDTESAQAETSECNGADGDKKVNGHQDEKCNGGSEQVSTSC